MLSKDALDNAPEPTPEVIAAALVRAKELVSEGASLETALSNATTHAQCQGFMGFKVFAAARSAVDVVLPEGVSRANFSKTATPDKVTDILHQAWLVVTS